MDSPYHREIEVARRLAREAGILAMKYRDGELDVELKDGDEPVTVADHKSSEHIVRGLEAAFPDDVVISEETADDLRRLTARRVWYIDPIDGTKDFIRGNDGFSVMIGLTLEHRPVAGVVYAPTSDRMFCGDSQRTWLEIAGQDDRTLTVSDVADPAGIRLVASKSHRSKKIDKVKSALGINNEFNIGSVGLKLSLIALGERDLYVNPSPHCKYWDTCAPEVLLEGAGGKLTDVHGDPLRYDLEDVGRPRGLIASNGKVHDAVLERMRPLFPRDQPPDDEDDE